MLLLPLRLLLFLSYLIFLPFLLFFRNEPPGEKKKKKRKLRDATAIRQKVRANL